MKKQQQVEQHEQINTAWMVPKTLCWVQIGNEDQDTFPDLFAPAEVVELQDQKITVAYTKHQGLPSQIDVSQVYQMNVYEENGFIDMVVMESLNEAEILHNLRVRYAQNIIYTYIGPTLMVMNPYKAMDNQSDPLVLEVYQNQTRSLDAFNLRDSPPHTYAVAAYAYRKLFENTRNQAIVISGESGAGKTENAKIAMKFLTSLSESGTQVVDVSERIEEKIMACNPILESFGNAKTVRNDNSSRFGKYVRIIVNSESKRIKGAAINNYLLEKSRVVGPGPQERNYHVFYCLLKGCTKEQKEELKLTHQTGECMIAQDFEYLNQGECTEVPTINDERWFQELTESFEHIKFSKEELNTVLQSLSAIMLLGNLKFDTSTLTDKNPCEILNKDILEKISFLLAINPQDMTKTLTIKVREVGKTSIESPLNEQDAYSNRNALASNLYDRLFSWLVKRLNTTIIPKEDLQTNIKQSIRQIRRQSTLGIKLQIGLLDIFGFENFKHNSFEQYCINYTNEKLQQLYISYVFKSEEQEFINEGLKDFLSELNYSDNSAVMEMMDKPPQGIFDLIDESTQLGSGTDDALYKMILKVHKDNKLLLVGKSAKDTFSISHTAKNVEYNIVGFRSKNKSEISSDIVKGIMSSSNELLQQIFLVLCGSEVDNKAEELEKIKKPSKTDKFLGAKFRQQMKQLMQELSTSDCHFIRCLKPNEIKKPNQIVASYCLLQIKYLGVLESIKVRKDGFPYRKDYKYFLYNNSRAFYQQFHEISPKYRHTTIYKQQGNLPQICIEIVKQEDPTSLILEGQTKLFAKDIVGRRLDTALAEWLKHKQLLAKKIQRAYRRHLYRKHLSQNLHKLALTIRKFYRIIAHFRRRKQRKVFLSKKKSMKLGSKIFWHFQLKSAFHIYDQYIQQLIKSEKRKNALQMIIGTLYHIKTRRGFEKYTLQTIKKQQTISIQKMLTFRHIRQSKYFIHLKTQCSLRAEQIRKAEELARQIREAEELAKKQREAEELAKKLREAEELEKQLREAEELAKELREAEELALRTKQAEQLAKQNQEAQAQQNQEAQEQAQRTKEAQEQAQRNQEAQVKRDQEAENLVKQVSEAEQQAKQTEEKQKREDDQKQKKETEELDKQKQQAEEQNRKQKEAIETVKRTSDVEKSAKEPSESEEHAKAKEVEVQIKDGSKAEEKLQQEDRSIQEISNKNQENQNSSSQEEKQSREDKRGSHDAQSQKMEIQDNYINEPLPEQQPILKVSSSVSETTAAKVDDLGTIKANSDSNRKQKKYSIQIDNQSNLKTIKRGSLVKEMKDRTVRKNSQASSSPISEEDEVSDEEDSESLTSYISSDFFAKPKSEESGVQQNALRRAEQGDDVAAQRKRITVSNNVLPFIPKDSSDLQQFLVFRTQYRVMQPQFSDIPTSSDFSLNFDKIDKGFMTKVFTSHFLDYCSLVVRKRKKMFTEVPIDKIMSWSITPLDKSLTHVPVIVESQAKLCTQLVYQFSGESKSTQQNDPSYICQELIGHAFNNTPLIDEIYLLVLKQIIKNTTSTQLKYCQLLVGLASSVAPSPKALFPIMNCFEIGARAFDKRKVDHTTFAKIPLIIGVQGEEISELLKFAFLRLMKTFSRNRVFPPNATELQLTFAYRQLLVPVYMYQGNVDYLFIEPHFTERQLLEVIIKKYHMYPNWDNLGICRCSGYCEVFLEENSLVVDALRKIEELSKEIKSSGSLIPFPYLALRIKVFFVFQPYDLDSLCLYYMHFSNEYMKGNYSISQDLTSQLACMKIISEHGCLNKNKGQVPKFHASQYIPVQMLQDKDWVTTLTEKYKHFPHVDEMEARARFLEDIRRFPVFMTWQYPCNYSVKKEQPKAIILAIRPFQIYICDFENREIKQRYHFLQVILWAQQNDTVTIETEDGIEHKFKMYRGVDDSIGFNSIMKTYMDRAMLQQEGV